jgi:Tol biopolymer transport system component
VHDPARRFAPADHYPRHVRPVVLLSRVLPDGHRIAVVVDELINGYEHRYSLAVGQVDGSDVQRLPATSGSLVWTLEPHWSPDGTSIVYVVTTAPDGAHLYHVRPNGAGNTVITVGWQPAW